jgi:hypothetical protein
MREYCAVPLIAIANPLTGEMRPSVRNADGTRWKSNYTHFIYQTE